MTFYERVSRNVTESVALSAQTRTYGKYCQDQSFVLSFSNSLTGESAYCDGKAIDSLLAFGGFASFIFIPLLQ